MNGVRDRASVVVVVLALLAAGLVLWSSQRARASLASQLEASNERVDELAEGVATLSGQVETLGGEPAVELERDETGPVPVEVPGPEGPPGPAGPAPSDEQVVAAVARYCGINDCVGSAGPEPTGLQVAAAVAAYCDARGECRGTAGADGAAGVDGESIVGPQGPGPTGEQIAAAVEAYCAEHAGCAGPAGAPGPQGVPGAPGPTCPDGADPIVWMVDQGRAAVIGLEPGSYLVCRAVNP